MDDFNKKLIEAKKKLDITGAELANLTGIPIDSLRTWLQNKVTPRKNRQEEVLAIIKKALG